jgi:hypothetical protein
MAKYVQAILDITEKYHLENFIDRIKILYDTPQKVDIRFGTFNHYLEFQTNGKSLDFRGEIPNKGRGFGSVLRWVVMMVAKQFNLKLLHVSINYNSFRQPFTAQGPPSWEIVSKAVKPNKPISFINDYNPITRNNMLKILKNMNSTPVVTSIITPNKILEPENMARLFRGKLLRFHKGGKRLVNPNNENNLYKNLNK